MDNARLRMEHQIMQMNFPKRFVFVMNTPMPYVDLGLRSNSDKTYRLRIMIPNDYPNSLPKVYMTFPKPLRDYDGRDLKEKDYSHDMHLLGPDDNGNIQLCHYKDENWHANVTLYKIALKARIWIEAYEGHLRTGRPIDAFVRS